jgi:hypothetical protein
MADPLRKSVSASAKPRKYFSNAGCCSRLTFSWVDRLLPKGRKGSLSDQYAIFSVCTLVLPRVRGFLMPHFSTSTCCLSFSRLSNSPVTCNCLTSSKASNSTLTSQPTGTRSSKAPRRHWRVPCGARTPRKSSKLPPSRPCGVLFLFLRPFTLCGRS